MCSIPLIDRSLYNYLKILEFCVGGPENSLQESIVGLL